jgi:hypothetical protein
MMNLYDQSISILEYAIYNIYSILIDQDIFHIFCIYIYAWNRIHFWDALMVKW